MSCLLGLCSPNPKSLWHGLHSYGWWSCFPRPRQWASCLWLKQDELTVYALQVHCSFVCQTENVKMANMKLQRNVENDEWFCLVFSWTASDVVDTPISSSSWNWVGQRKLGRAICGCKSKITSLLRTFTKLFLGQQTTRSISMYLDVVHRS